MPEISCPGDQRHFDATPQRAIARHDIVEADAAGLNTDTHIITAQCWWRNIFQNQRLGTAGRAHDHCFHLTLLCHRPEF
jgi:hypothetical protein